LPAKWCLIRGAALGLLADVALLEVTAWESTMDNRRYIGFCVLLCAFAANSAAGQPKPNFSGDWVLDLSASRLHPDFEALEQGTVRIVHDEPSFSFHRTFSVKGQPREVSYEITTDGRQHRSTGQSGGITLTTMRWEDTALMLRQRIGDPKAGELSNEVRYELLDDGRTLRATEDFKGAGRSHHNVWIFRRR
jgi:hypothetical protein